MRDQMKFGPGFCRARAAGIFLLSLLGATVAPAWGQTVLHVDGSAQNGGDGSAWGAAFSHPQQALDVAAQSPGQAFIIKVAQGRYVPTWRLNPDDPRSATFMLQNNLTFRGGYAGLAGADPDAHDPEQFETILSGDINNDDLPEFVNYAENVYHVLVASNTDASAVLEGFTVSGGNADVEGTTEEAKHLGGGLFADTSNAIVQSCRFIANHAYAGGGVYTRESTSMAITDCQFIHNRATNLGSAIRHRDSLGAYISSSVFRSNQSETGTVAVGRTPQNSVSVDSCRFELNRAYIAAGIYAECPADIRNSTFNFATAVAVGGALLKQGGIIADCNFHDNAVSIASGAINSNEGTIRIERCHFARNRSNYVGGVAAVSRDLLFINCSFTNNSAQHGGAFFIASGGYVSLMNCSVHGSSGHAIVLSNDGTNMDLEIRNSVIWGSSPGSIGYETPGLPPSGLAGATINITYSNIEGGWEGQGNINLAPLFARPGCDDLRVVHGSPCLNAGNNALIPPGVVTDLAGNPRIQNGIVDMGAYEGSFDALPPAACTEYMPQGVVQRLVPTGAFNPIERAAVAIINTQGPADSYATASQFATPQHSQADGYNELGDALNLDTSLTSAAYWARIIIPFDQSNLNGFNPLEVELTHFNPDANRWQLAAQANLQNSPGHNGSLGDRLVVEGTPPNWGWSFEMGDYGVFWDPEAQRGFAWANVDHAGDFAIGIQLPQCAGDCSYPPDNQANHSDLNILLSAWGATPAGPASFADFNRDGFVNVNDLLLLINSWGFCR